MAHVGLMGSTYSTLALAVERYVAVCHPFQARRYSNIILHFTVMTLMTLKFGMQPTRGIRVQNILNKKNPDILKIFKVLLKVHRNASRNFV